MCHLVLPRSGDRDCNKFFSLIEHRTGSHEEIETELFRFCGGLDAREEFVPENEFQNGFVALINCACLDWCFQGLGGNANDGDRTDFGEVLVLENDGVAVRFVVGWVISMEKTMWDELLVVFSRFVETDEEI